MTWFDTGYHYKKQITLHYTQVSGTADLSDFPALILEATDADLAAHVTNASGFDIIFTDSTEAIKLDHEIEMYVAASGRIIMWVRIPTLSHTADTIIYMYYGNSAISTSQEAATAVWNTNYHGVWHLKETAGTASSIKDSTTNANHATPYTNYPGATVGDISTTAGQIGNAQAFTGSSSSNFRGIQAATSTSLNVYGQTLTVSAWVKRAATNSHGTIVNHGVGGQGGYVLGVGCDTGTINQVKETKYGVVDIVNGAFPADTNWHYLVEVGDATNTRSYIDGTVATTANTQSWLTKAVAFNIGHGDADNGGNSQYWVGSIDEVRLSNNARPVGWIVTEYNNQSAPATFHTIGTEVPEAIAVIKDTTSRFRLMSANVLKDTTALFRLMSANQLKDTTALFRLVLGTDLKDTTSRFRLMSANVLKDTTALFRLMSANQLKNTASRLRLMSANQLKDTISRFDLVLGTNLKDTVSRLRLMSADQLKHATTRLRLMSANQPKDTTARFGLRQQLTKNVTTRFSLAVFKYAAARFRLKSANQLYDSATRFMLMSADQLKDSATRLWLVSTQLMDAASRFCLALGTNLKDTTARLRLRSADQLLDAVARFMLMSAQQLYDVATYVKVCAPVVKDIATQINLAVTNLSNIVSRFTLISLPQYGYLITRFNLVCIHMKHTATRFILALLNDVASRFNIVSEDIYNDITSRFVIQPPNTPLLDITAQFLIRSADQLMDTASRLCLIMGWGIQDTATRFRQYSGDQLRDITTQFFLYQSPPITDISARIRLHCMSWLPWGPKYFATRFNLSIPVPNNDLNTLLCLCDWNYAPEDAINTRLNLAQPMDVPTLLKLHCFWHNPPLGGPLGDPLMNIWTRFNLTGVVVQHDPRDISCRFTLMVENDITWVTRDMIVTWFTATNEDVDIGEPTVWSPIAAGDARKTHHAFTTDTGVFQLYDNSVQIADNLIKLHMENVDTQVTVVAQGIYHVTNAALGLADFTPAPVDVATPGIYRVYPVIQLSSGPMAMDAQLLEILGTET